MTLLQLFKELVQLMKDKNNENKEIIGDVKPGLKVIGIKKYGEHFIAIYDEREK